MNVEKIDKLIARTIPLEIWEQYKQAQRNRAIEILDKIEREAKATRGEQW